MAGLQQELEPALAVAKKNILSSELVVFIQTLVFFQQKASSPAQRAG